MVNQPDQQVATSAGEPGNFIRQIINADRADKRIQGPVVTRFPPEPNGYLHIGHAKSICLNFGIARDYHGQCALRFDDTNPARERSDYVQAIQQDVRWLGFDWGDNLRHASDYFDQLYAFAEQMIGGGHAYVCELNPEQIRLTRGTLTTPGQSSPYRDRTPQQSQELFRRMRSGEFTDGAMVLRARIDMASPNLNLRDPVLYRILRAPHPITDRQWCIYPMYDFAHALSDAIEGVTHSLCTLEFEDHRPLYDWFLVTLKVASPPRQYEFSRLNLSYTVMSKRLLTRLVSEQMVDGWSDPRMPTLAGMRRRGYTPTAIRRFCADIGVTKKNNTIDLAQLENCLREDLEANTPRAMGVLRPLKLVIENYPEGREERLAAPNHPGNPDMGLRMLPFARELWIEGDDFMEIPPGKFYRLAPGREVRLRYAYIVTCTGFERDPDSGAITEVRARYDPQTRGGTTAGGRKVRGTIHWVSKSHAATVPIRLYDRLFVDAEPGPDLIASLNPNSLTVCDNAMVEPSLLTAKAGERYQLERLGYFVADTVDSTPGRPVFNRTVTLRDTWGKIAQRG